MEPSHDTNDEPMSSANLSELLVYLQSELEQPIDDTTMKPCIEILEQPKAKVRFRYECEGRSAGSIMGAMSTNDTKTYPTIKIRNYQGDAHVVVSCVTMDEPYRPHPHKLVGKDNCKDGIFFTHFNNENNDDMKYTFTNLGIQCMKKKDIKKSLDVRESQGVDPFETGYAHRENTSSINLNAVRICFQVFLPIPGTNNVRKLKPVVSEPIFDAKSNSDLIIHTLSHVSAPVAGGMKMILLCDKVNKDDIKIRFFEEHDGTVVWENHGLFSDKDVHKQVAIVFQTPPYQSFDISEPVNVKVQLVNNKGSVSDPYNFKLTPLDSGRPIFWRYRKNKAQPLAVATLFPNSVSNSLGESKDTSDENVRKESDYASIDKSLGQNSVKPSVTFSNHDSREMETGPGQVPDVLFDTKETVDERFEELLNEVSSLNHTLAQDNDFVLIEDNNNANVSLDELDEFNNNVNESSVTIQELDQFPLPGKEHLGGRTEGYGSYSSLQLAMKNQFFIDRNSGAECYEDVLPPEEVPTPPQARPPPRPPSHTKPNLASLQRKSTSDKFEPAVMEDATPPLPPKRVRRSGVDRNLPPVPKYKSFFHKLFFKSKSKSKPTTPRERSLSIDSRKVGGGSINDDVMLTEAEHYALYTSVAPHATQSEFDEASFYYSPVEGLAAK